jgi:CheY-like chemotaxis protein
LDSATLIPTGIEPIDDALGGLDLGRAHVVYGAPETGKTSLALRFVAEGLARGEPCVLVVRYPGAEAVRQIRALGRDCAEDLRSGRLAIFEFATDLVDRLAHASGIAPVLDEFERLLAGLRPRRFAFDTADFVFSIQIGYGFSHEIPAIASFLAGTGAATLLVVDERAADRIVHSFRASAPTVIRTHTVRANGGVEHYMTFEKSATPAASRKYALGPGGFATVEIHSAHAPTLPLTPPSRRISSEGRTGQLVVPDEAARLVAEAAGEPMGEPPIEPLAGTAGAPSGEPSDAPSGEPAPPRFARVRPLARHARVGRPRVLVVDDDPVSSALVERTLGHECDVTIEDDAISALARIAEVDPDLVVVELDLPVVDGVVVCRQLRDVTAAPILAISATRTTPTDRVASAEAGADLFLPKPIDLRELAARTRQFVARFRGLPPPVGAALVTPTSDPLVTFDELERRLAMPVARGCALVGCRLAGGEPVEDARAIDVVRAELRPDDFLAYEPATRAIVAVVAPDAADELAGLLERRTRERAGLDLEFWVAPVTNGEGPRLLAERLAERLGGRA